MFTKKQLQNCDRGEYIMKISIITIVKNGKDLIERTLQSVVNQTYNDFEYIVIDGLSDDGTLECITRYKQKITKLISEKDAGISDAFNKGIKNSSGKWIMFLNAGDYFAKTTFIEDIVKVLATSGDMDIVYGKINVVNGNGDCLKTAGDADYMGKIRWHMPFPHQATFHNRRLFDELGMYDLSFKRAMDYEFILRKKKLKVKYVPMIFSNMLAGGVSQSNYKALFNECFRAHRLHYRDSGIIVFSHYLYMLWRVRIILLVRFLIGKEIKA
jgi:glycosyltransferase involved in cell wall biosynthesis